MRQQPTFYRLDRPLGGAGRERQDSGPSLMVPLPPGWSCLPDCNLSGQLNNPVVVPFVLLHPDIGVALIDVAPASNPDAEITLRRRLEAARFESIFPGFLPVLHLQLERGDLPATETILRDTFAALPPLSVPGGDGWVSVVRRALMPRDPSRGSAHSGLSVDHVARSPRRAETFQRAGETGAETWHRDAAAGDAPTPGADEMSLEPPLRPAHPLPLIIMSGVGGLIAVLAVIGLLNTGADRREPAGETATISLPEDSVAPPAPPPLAAATAPTLIQPPPRPQARSAPNPVVAAPQPQRPEPPPQAPAVAPRPAMPLPPPPAPEPPTADSNTGASAAPAPAQGPTAAAADRLPRITVRLPANLRSGPNGQANAIRVVPRGEVLKVHDRTANGWFEVGDDEPWGWIHTSRLGPMEEAPGGAR